jgi:predicted nucleic acid-binding protein
MPQLCTCVPKSLAARVAARAKARGVPLSRYLADVIRRDVELGWPDDLVIAATALAHDLTLITDNVGEFSRISGLKIKGWERNSGDIFRLPKAAQEN